MADPDRQIRGWGGGGLVGAGHPDPGMRGGAVSKKNFFGPSGLILL